VSTLLNRYEERDVEVLIFLLHNVGLKLRKADPAGIKRIIELAEQKKNSYEVAIKMEGGVKSRKVDFLQMELADIKNNKGTTTLQVKSIEYLETWLRKNKHLQSQNLIKPLNLTLDDLGSLDHPGEEGKDPFKQAKGGGNQKNSALE